MEYNREVNLCKICIVSGPSVNVDLVRADTAISYRNGLAQKVPIKILGAGPDLEQVLQDYHLLESGRINEEEFSRRQGGLDHHLELYNHLLGETGEKPETVMTSITLVQDVFHGFSDEIPGVYGIVTEPWHYKKADFARRVLTGRGKIPKGIGFVNIASPDTEYYNLVQKMASWGKTWVGLLRV